MEGPGDVRFDIEFRARDRRPDARPGREMYDCVRFFRRDGAQNGILISDINCVQVDIGNKRLEILPFNAGIVKVVKIVDYANRVPVGQQRFGQVRTYKSGTSGDQYLHIAEGSKLGGKRGKCKEELPGYIG